MCAQTCMAPARPWVSLWKFKRPSGPNHFMITGGHARVFAPSFRSAMYSLSAPSTSIALAAMGSPLLGRCGRGGSLRLEQLPRVDVENSVALVLAERKGSNELDRQLRRPAGRRKVRAEHHPVDPDGVDRRTHG